MNIFFKIVLFSLVVIGGFGIFSNFGIPRIEPAPPPKPEVLDLDSMTMEQFIVIGERIFLGKGTCTLCHNDLGRAPMLDQMGGSIDGRLKDARYQGEAIDQEGYIVESMIKPSAFVVPGFGKKGSNDTVSPMPNVTAGSIGLTEPELAAVTAYLMDSNGLDVTVEIPTDAAPPEEEEGDSAEPREPFEDIQDMIDEFGCGTCHIIGEDEGDLGPDLSKIGATRDREYIRRGILYPNADIAEGFDEDVMPDDLGDTMFAVEVERMTDYLAGLK